jgi:predicted small lipoprotein YifL
MRKIFSLILACLILMLLLTGCGGKAPAQSNEPDPSTSEPVSSSNTAENPLEENMTPEPVVNTSGGIYQEPGEELEDFYNALNEYLGVFERAVNGFESTDFELNARGDLMALTLRYSDNLSV